MGFNAKDFFEMGNTLGSNTKTAAEYAAEDVSSMFKERRKSDYEINKLKEVEKYKNSLMNPKEQAMTDYYKAQTDALKGGGNTNGYQPGDIEGIASSLNVSPEDIQLQPTVTRFKGQARVTNTPGLKPALPSKETEFLKNLETSKNELSQNLGLMTDETKKRMGPITGGKFGAQRGSLGNLIVGTEAMLGQPGAKEFSAFKAQVDQAFQSYRGRTTGAQASFKELGWLEPDYPQASDPPDVFMTKTKESIKRIEQNHEIARQAYSNAGYRTGNMKLGGNPLMQGIQNSGQSGQEDLQVKKDRLNKKLLERGWLK